MVFKKPIDLRHAFSLAYFSSITLATKWSVNCYLKKVKYVKQLTDSNITTST